MSKAPTSQPTHQEMTILSHLLLPPGVESTTLTTWGVANVNRDTFDHLLTLANSNHVIVRGFDILLEIMREAQDVERAGWVAAALTAEDLRIHNAVSFLHAICAAFTEEGHDVTVIKSLDHWPDLGSDLDLYTNADCHDVCALMSKRFQAKTAPRSWGDRLACKWNFLIPGLPEAVEIHMGRLGQTGEQVPIASWLARRAQTITIGDYEFRVPAASDRLMVSTLQRMYRHFYFRLCDIVDAATLAAAGAIDYENLRSSAQTAGIWEGVATYLVVVSDYLKQYRGLGLDFPSYVTESARFGGKEVYFARGFLRLPILPQSAYLYGSQLTGLLRKRELHNTARLGLLPWLATAAVVGHKITGSDKGIW